MLGGMDMVLQLWGGAGYLLAKAFLAYAEGAKEDRVWRMAGWLAYLAGLPAWVVLLAGRQNWIAAAIEAGGAPALVLGLVSAWKRWDAVDTRIDFLVRTGTCLMIVGGIAYSVYCFKGITTLSQALELGVTFGFLLGTYLLAKKKAAGWLLFALMLGCMGSLMYLQDKTVLAVQQGISLLLVAAGFIRALRRAPQGSGAAPPPSPSP
ncbi:MAG: multidrug transporter [Spirochaetaceae bacterium]|jgi:hypothetical protein|nr:multidrug transporter [Spirochaetaceae bacterium]